MENNWEKGTIYKTLRVQEIWRETKEVATFVFDEESTYKIQYSPGQYLTLVLANREEEIRRSYSIASTPASF